MMTGFGKSRRMAAMVSLMAISLSGCASMATPGNLQHSIYAAQQRPYAHVPDGPGHDMADHDPRHNVLPACAMATVPDAVAQRRFVAPSAMAAHPDILTNGDRLRLAVAGDTAVLTGTYVVAADGHIVLPGGLRVAASARALSDVERDIAEQLVSRGLVRRLSNNVRLQQVELSGITVAVSGAVFEGGTIRVGERPAEVRTLNLSNIVSGDLNTGRTLTSALRNAGGVRPDADVRAVYVLRGSQWTQVDLSGAVDGAPVDDIALMPGDQVIVPSIGCLQDKLVRPSPITAPGIRVFISSLSRPAAANSTAGINKDATSLPYGTRFSQALFASNCVGGSAMNAGRSVVLFSRNPINGQSIVIERSVERLMRDADRDAYDPFLMPGDAIACYDSAAMNLRDVVSVISETVTPFVLFRNASRP